MEEFDFISFSVINLVLQDTWILNIFSYSKVILKLLLQIFLFGLDMIIMKCTYYTASPSDRAI